MELTSDITDFTRRDINLLGKTKPVLVTGTEGPAVIVIHEIYGFTPTIARFCRWVRDARFRVYAPILFGKPDAGNPEEPSLLRTVSLCISRDLQFSAPTNRAPRRIGSARLRALPTRSPADLVWARSACA